MQAVAGGLSLGLIALQLPATALLLSRLLRGARRQRPLQPRSPNGWAGSVSIVIPTLNEAGRLEPCLQGLCQQGPEVREIVVVDSRSTDGTPALVGRYAKQDRRIRLVNDGPLPERWVGRPWALQTGWLKSDPASDWILGIDADTRPQPGLVASVLQAAAAQEYDLLSLSPRFILHTAGEWWLQPALLMTLVYRFDSAGVLAPAAERVMANGQCFLVRRSLLEALGGYACAADSFCDDVTLARTAARAGYRVGFLDGANVIFVRMYEGLRETWSGWGRSLDLKDATSRAQLYCDLGLLTLTQALPLPLLVLLAGLWKLGAGSRMLGGAIALNALLLVIRVGMQAAIAGSYVWPQRKTLAQKCFWLAPLADPLAVFRIARSAFQTQISWRGKVYQK